MIIIIIIIIIIKTITSLKIWEVCRNSASYSLIVTFTRRKNIGVSAAATTYLTPLIWREDPGQSYPEETKDKHRGSSTRKPLCMVFRSGSTTTDRIFTFRKLQEKAIEQNQLFLTLL